MCEAIALPALTDTQPLIVSVKDNLLKKSRHTMHSIYKRIMGILIAFSHQLLRYQEFLNSLLFLQNIKNSMLNVLDFLCSRALNFDRLWSIAFFIAICSENARKQTKYKRDRLNLHGS